MLEKEEGLSKYTTQLVVVLLLSQQNHKLLDINGSPNLGQKTRPYNNQQRKRTSEIVTFAITANHRIKLKEREKHKYLDLVGMKKLWNMKVTIILIVIDALGTVT